MILPQSSDRPADCDWHYCFSHTSRHLRPRHDCAFLISRSLPPPPLPRTTELHIYTRTQALTNVSVSHTDTHTLTHKQIVTSIVVRFCDFVSPCSVFIIRQNRLIHVSRIVERLVRFTLFERTTPLYVDYSPESSSLYRVCPFISA